VVTIKSSARWSAKGRWLKRRERIDACKIACPNRVESRHHECVFNADELMMLKMHVAGNDVVGKIRRALFARGERHVNQARVLVRHCPGRYRPNRNHKRNCEDKSDEPPPQFTPSMNRSIVSMFPATEHVSL
jgi:hypothetical protein